MKIRRYFGVMIAIAIVLGTVAHAQTQVTGKQPGVITDVAKYTVQSPEYPNSPNSTDAPLMLEHYAYDVSVRLDRGNYVVRYESSYDYLPSEIAVDQPVQVRPTKRELHFDLTGNRELKMAIVRTERGAQCASAVNR